MLIITSVKWESSVNQMGYYNRLSPSDNSVISFGSELRDTADHSYLSRTNLPDWITYACIHRDHQ